MRWVAVAVVLAACGRGGRAGGDGAGASGARTQPVVQCMAWRPCGCLRGCAGIAVPREALRAGLTAPVVAGDACGQRARVETALGPDGRMTFVLGTAGECQDQCGLTAMRAIDPAACADHCDTCGASPGPSRGRREGHGPGSASP
jgi:hypothetical protein